MDTRLKYYENYPWKPVRFHEFDFCIKHGNTSSSSQQDSCTNGTLFRECQHYVSHSYFINQPNIAYLYNIYYYELLFKFLANTLPQSWSEKLYCSCKGCVSWHRLVGSTKMSVRGSGRYKADLNTNLGMYRRHRTVEHDQDHMYNITLDETSRW